MNIDDLMRRQWPDDTTLAVCKAAFANSEEGRSMAALSRHKRSRLRFLNGEEEAPDVLTLAEWRGRPDPHVIVDDGEGGVRARQPETTT